MRARETLECRLLPAVEGKFAAGVGQLFHEGRGEDLSAAGFAGDPRSQDDGVSEEAVSVLPGSYIGRETGGRNPGQGYVRIALVAAFDECAEAVERLVSFSRRVG